MMNLWRWHVYDHQRYAGDLNIYIVFYERLLHDFRAELNKLLDYLDTNLTRADRQSLASAVSFTSMKRHNSNHLRKETWGNWKEHFSEGQKARTDAIVRPLTSCLNYHSSSLAHVPNHMDKTFLEEHLGEIGASYY